MSGAAPDGGAGRLPRLDALRAAAVLLVLGAHLAPPPSFRLPGLRAAFDWWIQAGPYGVDLFFVLSGFLVAGLLLREQARHGSIAWGRFFVRRGFKIYPGFWLLLLATLAVDWNLPRPATPERMLHEIAFLQNYLSRVWTHTWSLAVEEHFYFLLPALLLAIRRRGPGAVPFAGLPRVALAVLAAVVAARAAMVYLAPWHRDDVHMATHLRLDGLLFGVVLAWLAADRGARLRGLVARHRFGLGLASAAALLQPFWRAGRHARFDDAFGPVLLWLGFAGLLLLALERDWSGARPSAPVRALASLGLHSYSVYLWHMPVLQWGVGGIRAWCGGPLPWPVEVALFVPAAILAGVALAKLVELPALRLRDAWFPSRSAGA